MPALRCLEDFMPTCVRCGRELPSSSADASPLCQDCIDPDQHCVNSLPMWMFPCPPRSVISVTKSSSGSMSLSFSPWRSRASLSSSPPPGTCPLGSKCGPLSLGPQPWRMLTSNYVHIGMIHIFFNMWCLWNLGRLAERIFDRWTYLLVYTATGIGGSLASLWWHPRGMGAGASGAIFGLAGALIAVLYLGKLPVAKEVLKPTLKSLLTFPPTTCSLACCRASTTRLI